MGEHNQDNGDRPGGGTVTEYTHTYVLPQGEEPTAISMIIGTKSGKIFVSPANNLLQFLSMSAAGIETASQVLAQQMHEQEANRVAQPRIVMPNNVRLPKFGRN